MSGGICHAFIAVVYLGIAAGAKDISKIAGCWEYQLGRWKLALNGHPDPCESSLLGVQVQPYAAVVQYDDWPAAIIYASGGCLIGIAGATEDDLIRALEDETRRLGGRCADDPEPGGP